jgi:SulP family sulfate permease
MGWEPGSIPGALFFANTGLLEERVGALVTERPGVRAVVLDASATTDIDATGAHALHELASDLDAAGIALHLATVRGPIRDALARGGLWDDLAGRVHLSIGDACAAAAPGSPVCAVQADEDGTNVQVV